MSKVRNILIAFVFLVSVNVYSATVLAQSGALIWRGRVDALPDLPPPSGSSSDDGCFTDDDGYEWCLGFDPQGSGAVDLHSGEFFTVSFDPNCNGGRIRIYADWLGIANDLEVLVQNVNGTQENFDNLTDPSAFPVETSIPTSGMITVKFGNFGTNTVTVREFSYEIGCQVQVEVSDVWVDFDAIRKSDGLKGMLINSTFTILNQKDAETNINVYFHFDGFPYEPLKGFNDQYSTQDGQVSVGRSFKPSLIRDDYDFLIFMPYKELHLARGRFELVFFIEFFDKRSGEFIGESLPFQFWVVDTPDGEAASGGLTLPPTPTPTPYSSPTPLPTATPIPTVAPFQIRSPKDGAVLKCSPIFEWQDSIGLSSDHVYEIIFWKIGQDWHNEGRGATKADTRTSRIVDLNYLDDQREWFAPGEYEWGILDITTDPYTKHALLGYGGRFTFLRDGTCS